MKYRVDLTQTVTEAATVYIEADCQEDAEKKAIDLAYGADPGQPLPDPLDWRFIEVEGDIEVLSCEEWPPTNEGAMEAEAEAREP